MVGLTLKSALAVLAMAGFVHAVDPTPEERKKWDDKCKAKSGNMYAMVFDSNGKPTGTCRAPPYQGCYWGPYKDPKTGADGCCEKGNGVFTTDPVAVLEGGCCIAPEIYSFDSYAKKGGCCPKDTQISWDLTMSPVSSTGTCCPPEQVASTDRSTGQNHCCPPGLAYSSHLASGKGECCEPGKTFSFDENSQKGDCCAAGQSYKVDPLTGKGGCCGAGADYKCDCKCVTPGDNKPAPIDDKDKPAPSEEDKDDKNNNGGDNAGDKNNGKDNGADIGDPKHCPEVAGRVVTVGGITYEIQCDHGISDRFDSYREKTTKDVGECMAACSADPRCQGANLYDDGADEGCVMMKDWEYPASGGVDPTANMMSFVPIKKR